ncbi:MAG: hypothetical protein HC849_25865, partial [Oscillatoriales cyanobacterium RU_3_3]|nr:hypothetical protein [Oscillatoriales cyanobacterium RU_3_3]
MTQTLIIYGDATTVKLIFVNIIEGRRQKEEGRRKKEEARRRKKREEGRRKRQEGQSLSEYFPYSPLSPSITLPLSPPLAS